MGGMATTRGALRSGCTSTTIVRSAELLSGPLLELSDAQACSLHVDLASRHTCGSRNKLAQSKYFCLTSANSVPMGRSQAHATLFRSKCGCAFHLQNRMLALDICGAWSAGLTVS